MAQQPEQQAFGAIQGLGGPRGWNQGNNLLHQLQQLGLLPSSNSQNAGPGAVPPPNSTDSFNPSGDNDSDGNSSNAELQQELQQLQQEIQQLMQQLEQDTQRQDQQAASQDQQQLAQDLAALQQLTGGGGGGGIPEGGGGGGCGGVGGGGCAGVPSIGGGGGGGGESGGGCAASGAGGASSASCAGSSSGSTYDGSNGSVGNQTLLNNVKAVAAVAEKDGVNPQTAVATMLTESNGNNTAVGDNGTSFGLFQLHEGGELGNLTQAQADNPTTNATVALGEFASVQKSTGLTGGALAAAAQRPADPTAYAQSVNNNMGQAASLLKQAGVSS